MRRWSVRIFWIIGLVGGFALIGLVLAVSQPDAQNTLLNGSSLGILLGFVLPMNAAEFALGYWVYQDARRLARRHPVVWTTLIMLSPWFLIPYLLMVRTARNLAAA